MNTKFDIVIVGAGPAGCACALALQNSGLQVALIDKEFFPRNKTCGDAIPGLAFKTLKKIIPNYENDWKNVTKKNILKSTLVTANGKHINIQWTNKAYNCQRMHFDNYLLQKVKSNTQTTIFEGVVIENILRKENKVCIKLNNNSIIETKLIIGCDGAYSMVKKYLFPTISKIQPAVAIRAYLQNLNLDSTTNYFYLNKKVSQSYLWIFPLQDGIFNVGFGIIPNKKSIKIDTKKVFLELIEKDKNLKNIFSQEAIQQIKIDGFKLPLFTNKINISTNNCMLCGDAANLIDPIQGHGIDKAMESGRLAAMQAIQCFEQNKFDNIILKNYDSTVYKTIGKELIRNKKILFTITKFPFLLNAIATISNNKIVQNWLKKLS